MKISTTGTDHWLDTLPTSQIHRPVKAKDRAKYLLWRAFSPVHPRMRRAAEVMGIRSERFVMHDKPGRQQYLLGTIAPGHSPRDIVERLIALGYGNHFLAWHDENQVVSLRLVESFTHQYHIRIFEDGEIRGHYEFTPESNPIRHLFADGQIDRRDVFYEHLGNLVIRV